MPPRTAASNPSGPHHIRASSCQTHRHLTLNEFFIVALIQRFPSCERIPKYAWDKIGFLSKREKIANREKYSADCLVLTSKRHCVPQNRDYFCQAVRQCSLAYIEKCWGETCLPYLERRKAVFRAANFLPRRFKVKVKRNIANSGSREGNLLEHEGGHSDAF